MPVEIGYVPAAAAPSAHGVDVPDGLPSSTTDLLISAPKTVSVLYAAFAVRERFEEADSVLAAHHAGVDAAVGNLNDRASAALVYRGAPRLTPGDRLAQMLEREPGALPERREHLARQVRAEVRDPAAVEYVASTGLRINQLFHCAHDNDRGDPHLHTHLFVDAEVTGLDGRGYPRDPQALWDALRSVMQAYDYRVAAALTGSVGVQMALNERTGVRDVEGITEKLVSAYPGEKCVPDRRFHQVPAHRWIEPCR